jgi:hypothetical protein
MAAMIQKELTGAKISAILNSDGPIVSCIFIPGDTGIAEEIKLDMTPKVAAPKNQLGGSPTFAGTITALDVVIMCLREPAWGTKPNPHVLPVPMEKSQIPGPILMIRMDENSEPQNFTLKEYNEYKANPAPVPVDVSSSSSSAVVVEEEEEEEEEEEDAVDEEGDSDGDEDYMEHVVKRIAIVFKQQTGRDPTPEEVSALLENMNGDPDEAPSEDEEDEQEDVENNQDAEEEEEPNEVEALEAMSPEDMAKLLRSKLAEAFQQSQGRAPTEDEVDQLLQQMSQDTELQDDLLRVGHQQQSDPETPAPVDGKKRKLEGADDTENPTKKTSPASVTDSLATNDGN